jgi:hypothetical protein
VKGSILPYPPKWSILREHMTRRNKGQREIRNEEEGTARASSERVRERERERERERGRE